MTTLTAANPSMGGTYLPSPSAVSPTALGSSLTGADIIRVLRQRLVMIIFLWIFLGGLAVGGVIFWRVKYPTYVTWSDIRVVSLDPVNPADPLERERPAEKEIERELQNQAFRVQTTEVLSAALAEPSVRQTEWFRQAQIDAKRYNERMEDLLLDVLSVGPLKDTNLVRVRGYWRVPSEVQTIVNTVVQKYRQQVERDKELSLGSLQSRLREEVDRARNAVENKKKEIEQFRTANEFSDSLIDQGREQLLLTSSLIEQLRIDVEGRKSLYNAVAGKHPKELGISPDLQAILNSDAVIVDLRRQLSFAEQNLRQAKDRYLDNHRTFQELQQAYDSIKQTYTEETAIRVVEYNAQMIAQAERNYLELQEQLIRLQGQHAEAQAVQQDRERKKAKYEDLILEQEMLRLAQQELEQKQRDVDIIHRQEQKVQIDIVSSAFKPESISSPQLLTFIPLGAFGALLLSVGFALLLEVSDKSVRTARDVMRTQLPVLGTIPTTDDDEVDIEHVETACLEAPHSVVAEAFRNLRANLFFSAPAEQQGVILVTSPSGGNGKTTIATNLAISIALSGRRVLLIDANFRRSSIPRIFPNTRVEGLSNILIGQGYLKDYVTETAVPGLDVLSAGPIPPNPAELLGSSYLRDVVVDARSRYDQVIFDGPPVLLVSDAMVLAGAVDGCLLVCQYRKTSRGALQRSQSNLEAIGARIFGAVLNEVQTRAGGYFRKVYREFYDYQDSEDEAGRPRPQLDVSSIGALSGESRVRPHNGARGDIGGHRLAEADYAAESGESAFGVGQSGHEVRDAIPDEVAPVESAGAYSTIGEREFGDLGRDYPLPDIDRIEIPRPDELDAPRDDFASAVTGSDQLGDALDTDDFKIDDDFDLGDDLGDFDRDDGGRRR